MTTTITLMTTMMALTITKMITTVMITSIKMTTTIAITTMMTIRFCWGTWRLGPGKGLWFSVSAHVDNEEQYIQAMEKFGDTLAGRKNAEVGSAFLKFAVFTKELRALFKNLVRLNLKFSHICSAASPVRALVNFLFADAEHEQHHQFPSGQSAEGRPEGSERGGSRLPSVPQPWPPLENNQTCGGPDRSNSSFHWKGLNSYCISSFIFILIISESWHLQMFQLRSWNQDVCVLAWWQNWSFMVWASVWISWPIESFLSDSHCCLQSVYL